VQGAVFYRRVKKSEQVRWLAIFINSLKQVVKLNCRKNLWMIFESIETDFFWIALAIEIKSNDK